MRLRRRKVGDGVEARKGKRVGMYYRGWLESNKKEFDVWHLRPFLLFLF